MVMEAARNRTNLSKKRKKQLKRKKKKEEKCRSVKKCMAHFQNGYGIILKLQNSSYCPRIKEMIR